MLDREPAQVSCFRKINTPGQNQAGNQTQQGLYPSKPYVSLFPVSSVNEIVAVPISAVLVIDIIKSHQADPLYYAVAIEVCFHGQQTCHPEANQRDGNDYIIVVYSK